MSSFCFYALQYHSLSTVLLFCVCTCLCVCVKIVIPWFACFSKYLFVKGKEVRHRGNGTVSWSILSGIRPESKRTEKYATVCVSCLYWKKKNGFTRHILSQSLHVRVI